MKKVLNRSIRYKITHLRRKHKSQQEIAVEIGCSRSLVSSYLITKKEPTFKSNNWTPLQDAEIIALVLEQKVVKEISEITGRTPIAIIRRLHLLRKRGIYIPRLRRDLA